MADYDYKPKMTPTTRAPVKRYELVGVNGPLSFTGTCGKCQMIEATHADQYSAPFQWVRAEDHASDLDRLEREKAAAMGLVEGHALTIAKLEREVGELRALVDKLRTARSGVSDERLPELKLWLDRKWNRHQEEEDLEAGNALCELISIRALLKGD